MPFESMPDALQGALFDAGTLPQPTAAHGASACCRSGRSSARRKRRTN